VLVRDNIIIVTDCQSKAHNMSDPRPAGVFDANLPNLARPVRINSFFDAQVFVRRWAIRDKDPAVRLLLRRMEKAISSQAVAGAIKELKRELAVRGLLPDMQSPLR
jgi:hypothetical protein